MKVEDIVKATNGKLLVGKLQENCENFCTDTRKIQKGDVYVGLKGEKFNGNEYYKEALEKGAKVAVISGIKIADEELKRYKDKTIVEVEDSLEAFGNIAAYKRELYHIPVVQITGSVGKTSTRDIVANVVRTQYKTLQTEGNQNNAVGLPTTLLKLKDHEAVVVESGMNHLGEIRYLGKIAKPTVAVITNVGTAHIGFLGSRENILKAKLEILEGNPKAKVIINNDNDLLHKWYEENKNKIEIHTFGILNKSEEKNKLKINVPVGGEHFVYNALCATEVGRILGISDENIKNGIERFELTKKRMDIKKLQNGAILINDAYNASYESMKVSLEFLAKHTGTRKIAVLGDMFELGEYSEELHRNVGKEVVKNNIDILICAGENSKYIIEEAQKSPNIQTYFMNNNEQIVENLSQKLRKGDVVLIKASNGMKFFEICQKL